MMRKILYISHSGLPTDAAGVRTFNIGAILEDAGCSVHYISLERSTAAIRARGFEPAEPADFPFLIEGEDHYRIGDKVFSYLPSAPEAHGKLFAVSEILELVTARRAFRRIVEYCDREQPEAIILYNDTYSLTRRLIPFCKKRGVRLYADVTEWYELSLAQKLASRIKCFLCEQRLRHLDRRLDGVIAISDYLYRFYTERGARVMWLPPLMEMEIKSEARRHSYYPDRSTVNFVYAGAPGGKDILLPFVRAVQSVNRDGVRVRFDIVGISPSYFEKAEGVSPELETLGIFAHGRLPRERTIDIVERADFGVLLRHGLRYARAGFSTKFAEAMCLGTPMLCNPIGGCDTLITDGENGLLVDRPDEAALVKLLERVLEMGDGQILDMKNNALRYAEDTFTIRMWRESVMNFILSEDRK